MDEEYDKISVLGRGSFGLIQLCRRRVDNTVVVVKQINTPINEEDSKVVAKEVSILSSLRHRHIVRYFDTFLDAEGRLSIVMEWARGGSLEELIQRRSSTCNSMGPSTHSVLGDTGNSMGPFTQGGQFGGLNNNVKLSETENSMGPFTQGMQFGGLNNNVKLSETENSMGPFTQGVQFSATSNSMGPFTQDTVLTMLAQLCDGLAYLHSRRIVHRDLCARNVLLCGPSVSNLYLKLCDFGVSKLLEESLIGDGSSGQLKGSLECLSPEQCMGLPYTTGCDIWALGCLLHRLITLRHPFPIDNMATLSRHLISGHFEIVTECEPRLASLLTAMLSRDPHLRPTAHDLLHSPLITPYVYTLYTKLFTFDVSSPQ
ncbi:hypothetical protein LSTR_LSTR010461 [Laodelphax striatellus]|uniref:non-specific serine/threonine protein kinase n=1 Tax=Laodelphax striatellus TaxID=195883 RepID=A0A482WVL4_LAOST|nr:hypothetical protein LSTR_LSTR010461 [Laodelphax striatellus]